MTYSVKTYTGDGVTTDFAVTFDYLDQSHVRVTVDKVPTNAVGSLYKFTWNNSTNIRVDTVIDGDPVPAGIEIKLSRETPINTPAVVFAGGASLTSENLNKNSEYLTFALQEATDANEEFTKLYLGAFAVAPTVDNEGEALLTGAVYYDTTVDALYYWTGTVWIVGESTSAAEIFKDAAELARDEAVTARVAAVAAQAAAEAAQSTAETARDTAVAAQSASETARDQAETARNQANTAATTASNAATAAASSESTATSASASAAISASSAGSSATAASASASQAASSETSAGASATAAANSASAASTDADDAAASASSAATSAADAAAAAAGVTIATQAEAEAGADNTKVMSPLRTRQAIQDYTSGFRTVGYANVTDGTNPIVVAAQGGFSSITRPSTGQYVFVFTTPLADANYFVETMTQRNIGARVQTIYDKTINGFTVNTRVASTGGFADIEFDLLVKAIV